MPGFNSGGTPAPRKKLVSTGNTNANSKFRGSSAGNSSATSSTPRSGWDKALAHKRQAEARSSKNKPAYLQTANKFWLVDGETAMIQFLDDEPVFVEGVLIPPDFKDFYVSRKEVDRHCPFVERKYDITAKCCFKLLDFRGEWDKDKQQHKWNKPVEKYWLCSNTVALQLKTIVERKNRRLSEMVFDVTRSGSDKQTTYNFEQAEEDGSLVKAITFTPTLPSTEVAMRPLEKDAILALLGEGETPNVKY